MKSVSIDEGTPSDGHWEENEQVKQQSNQARPSSILFQSGRRDQRCFRFDFREWNDVRTTLIDELLFFNRKSLKQNVERFEFDTREWASEWNLKLFDDQEQIERCLIIDWAEKSKSSIIINVEIISTIESKRFYS